MNLLRVAGLLLGAAMLAACSGDVMPQDGAAESGTDATMGMDSGTDTGPRDAGPDVVYGMCGMRVYNCLCACQASDGGTDCVNNCLGQSQTCISCVRTVVTGCCPAESNALANCVQAAQVPTDTDPGCAGGDIDCALMHCMAENTALTTCFSTDTCTNMLRRCTGTWPESCGP